MAKIIEIPKLVGSVIKKYRRMTFAELEAEGWTDRTNAAMAIEFTNGLIIYASKDDEGNGPGVLFARYKNTGVYLGEA